MGNGQRTNNDLLSKTQRTKTNKLIQPHHLCTSQVKEPNFRPFLGNFFFIQSDATAAVSTNNLGHLAILAKVTKPV